ncbi:DUF1566 domain-containing protein [Methylomonas paludis]|uniref:DUF1566 domain-containing protein n=1 Tax=Methylomonas paludis TaxID=1173101 RepID=A0A975MRV9_9GAMM|nr:DUF1566 domain-containing protein [Methylomonas paludis]QWF72401.1 DUF1566 domain-containing protein [Methylomonas paludis]
MLALVTLFITTAQAVTTGSQGPAGPRGPQGVQGPAGPRGTQGIQGPAGIGVTIHKKGDSYQGGIIFYVSADGQHGLIAARADQGSAPWNNGNFGIVGTSGDGLFAGAMNTTIEVATQIRDAPLANFAALLAANYSIHDDGITACSGSTTESCYGDWYLPSKQELKWLYQESKVVGGFVNYNNSYWSSTEYDQNYAWYQNFNNGFQYSNVDKGNEFGVRAIRAF